MFQAWGEAGARSCVAVMGGAQDWREDVHLEKDRGRIVWEHDTWSLDFNSHLRNHWEIEVGECHDLKDHSGFWEEAKRFGSQGRSRKTS